MIGAFQSEPVWAYRLIVRHTSTSGKVKLTEAISCKMQGLSETCMRK